MARFALFTNERAGKLYYDFEHIGPKTGAVVRYIASPTTNPPIRLNLTGSWEARKYIELSY